MRSRWLCRSANPERGVVPAAAARADRLQWQGRSGVFRRHTHRYSAMAHVALRRPNFLSPTKHLPAARAPSSCSALRQPGRQAMTAHLRKLGLDGRSEPTGSSRYAGHRGWRAPSDTSTSMQANSRDCDRSGSGAPPSGIRRARQRGGKRETAHTRGRAEREHRTSDDAIPIAFATRHASPVGKAGTERRRNRRPATMLTLCR
jgi:hypothetical protein